MRVPSDGPLTSTNRCKSFLDAVGLCGPIRDSLPACLPTRRARITLAPRTSLSLVAVFGLLTVGLVPETAAVAQTKQPEATKREVPRIELVLDVSGSMAADDAGGQTRMAAAKEAMQKLMDGIPDEAQVGLRVYGAAYGGDNNKKGCRDTQLLVPIGQMDDNKATVKDQVSALEPRGFTPIGRALRKAARDLGSKGQRRIILVSDGKDTCAPPKPCKVASELDQQGIGLTIDAVGFNVGSEAREQLQCIADRTDGRYADASEADELVQRIDELFRRAVREYQTSGQTIQGSRDGCQQAPLLKRDGQYLDHISYGHTAWYRIRVPQGQRVRASAATILTGVYGRGASVELTLARPDGEEVVSDYAYTMGWAKFIGNGVQTQRIDSDGTPPANGPTTLCLAIENGIRMSNGTLFPTEIRLQRFAEEPTLRTSAASSPHKAPGYKTTGETQQASADPDGPNVSLLLIAGLAVGGILTGSLTGVLLGRRSISR